MSGSDKAKFWRGLARRTCRKFNFGWWLDRLKPMLVATALIGAVTLVVLRTMRYPLDPIWVSSIGGGALLLIAGAAWAWARHSFISEKQALVQLESHLGLKNALTTADHGVAQWPTPPQEGEHGAAVIGAGLRWRWPEVFAPFVAAAVVVAAGLLVPVESVAKKDELPAAEPLAWNQMEEWLDTIEEQEIVEPEAIESYRESIKELREQPEDQWFSHSSMEASDSLRDALGREVQQLGADLNRAERDLDALQNHSEQMSERTRSQLIEEYQQAVKGLELGKLPLNDELMEALKGIDPSQLGDMMSQLTPEQLQQLQEQLKKGAQACKDCQGSGAGMPGMSEAEQLLSILAEEGQGGEPREGPGNGGIQRGRGDAPIEFGAEQHLDAGTTETVQNPDLSRAAPGDVLGTGETEHDIDEQPVTPTAGGAVSGTGQGGDAVWREALLPDEKAVLKKYFR